MSTEKHDPWALLREARDELSVLASYVGHPDTAWPNVGLKTTAKCHKIMRDRIDAALAEHEAVPPSEETVWHMTGSPVGTLTADLGDWVLRVRWDGQDAAWDATRYGRESDEKKAKSAAIRAARGMR